MLLFFPRNNTEQTMCDFHPCRRSFECPKESPAKKTTFWFFEAGPVQNAPDCSALYLSSSSPSFQAVFFLGSERKCSCEDPSGRSRRIGPLGRCCWPKAVIFCCQGPTCRPGPFLDSQQDNGDCPTATEPGRGPAALLPGCGGRYQRLHFEQNQNLEQLWLGFGYNDM